jgi:hypothetical protein
LSSDWADHQLAGFGVTGSPLDLVSYAQNFF